MKDTAKALVRRVIVETAVVMASTALVQGFKSAFNHFVAKRSQKKNNNR